MNAAAERVKEQVDIVQIIGSFLELKKGGAGELVGLCPFHKDKSPSFTVTPATQLYYCFGCSIGGDVFDFIKRKEGPMAFNACVKRVAELAGVDIDGDALPVSTVPTGTPGKRSMIYGAESGEGKQKESFVSGEIDHTSLPAASTPPVEGKVVATYPYIDEHGELLYEVQRIEPGQNGKKKEFRQRRPDPAGDGWIYSVKECRRVLFRLPEVLKADLVYVVEGEKDVLTLEAIGLVATTNSGGAAQEWSPEYTAALTGRRVVVIPDNDEPGKKRGAVILAALTGKAAETILVEIPAGKDVTEFIEAGNTVADIDALVEAGRKEARAAELEYRGLWSPTEIVQSFDGGINAFLDPSKRKPGLKTGFERLDDMTLGLHDGELIILAARPAMGKTALAMNIAVNVASTGSPVAVFSLEMSREQLLTRIICSRARIDQLRFRSGFLTPEDRRGLSGAFREICNMPLWIDDDASTTLKVMERKLVEFRARHGLAMAVVDYLQLMTASGSENRTQEVGGLSRGLKLMARKLGVPFLVLSQLSRATESRQGDHRPRLSDLRESGGIEQDADLVAFIYREEVYKPEREDLRGLAELILAKQRNGPIGRIDLVFLHTLTKFENRAFEQKEAA